MDGDELSESVNVGGAIPSSDLATYTWGDPVPRAVAQAKMHWYVGIPGSGKTFLAFQHAKEDSVITKRPILVINSAKTRDFDLPMVNGPAEAIRMIWQQKKSCQIYPEDIDDVEVLVRPALEVGRIHLVIDEVHYWIKARSVTADSPLTRLSRAYRHADTAVYLTTQHFSGDIPSEMVSCAPEFYVFRCTAPAVLDRLEREHGLDRAIVRQLEPRRFLMLYEGFNLNS